MAQGEEFMKCATELTEPIKQIRDSSISPNEKSKLFTKLLPIKQPNRDGVAK